MSQAIQSHTRRQACRRRPCQGLSQRVVIVHHLGFPPDGIPVKDPGQSHPQGAYRRHDPSHHRVALQKDRHRGQQAQDKGQQEIKDGPGLFLPQVYGGQIGHGGGSGLIGPPPAPALLHGLEGLIAADIGHHGGHNHHIQPDQIDGQQDAQGQGQQGTDHAGQQQHPQQAFFRFPELSDDRQQLRVLLRFRGNGDANSNIFLKFGIVDRLNVHQNGNPEDGSP